MNKYDYSYELSDEQLLRYSKLPPIAKLTWLDQARRFTLMARRAREAYHGDRAPEESAVPAVREPD
ncbi:MAG: hypothetical protein AABM33_09600 [Pseudomonadota bacterium]